MGRSRKIESLDDYQRHLKNKYGIGQGANYKPWLRIQDVKSKSKRSLIYGRKSQRDHHMMSSIESEHFYLAEFSSRVVDIREQFPLFPLNFTQKVAKTLGVKHPTHPDTKEPIIMTTDQLLTIDSPQGTTYHAVSVKPEDDSGDLRVLEKIDIERVCWELLGVKFSYFTGNELTRVQSGNLHWATSPFRENPKVFSCDQVDCALSVLATGQDKMGLLPAFSKSGASGRERTPTTTPLGAPKQPRTIAVDRAAKYIVSDDDKNKFKRALKKYYLKESGLTLAKTYDNLLKDSYSNEINLAEACGRPPLVPTKKQFSYWRTKLFSKEEIIKQRTSENDFLRNKRGALGSITDRSYLPGVHFEIDATVADVHIVSELGSQYVLGRPTIYIVADRASRMIVGMHVSLYHASWRAARQALANSFLPKSTYCKSFGVDIEDSEWPCAHIPKELVCDNGEMIGVQPKKALTPMTQLSFTPPYRPDCKGVVEKRFDIINKEVLHELLGTTRGGQVVRGSRDPRKDAIYTLKEITVEIIKAVLEHNRSILDGLAFSSPLLIENDLSPTPLNYWKIHLAKHRHELQSANSDEVIARLLPSAEVSMTRSGIYFNGMYYTCSEVEELNLASVARSSGRWRLEARIDENTTNYIYVRLDKNKEFIRCNLLPRSRMLGDKSMYESDFIQDWLDTKKELTPISTTSIDDHKHRQEVTRQAKKRSKDAEKVSFRDKTANARQRRKEELEATTNMIASTSEPSAINKESAPLSTGNKVVPLPKGPKRRASRGES